jgi:ribonuclease HII
MLLQYEIQLWNKNITKIAGVDEVGRGALAGPLVVGAVILDKNHLHQVNQYDEILNRPPSADSPTSKVQDDNIPNQKQNTPAPPKISHKDLTIEEIIKNYQSIKDSKKIAAKKREKLSEFIKKIALSYAIEEIPNDRVDLYGIAKATQIAFYNATKKLKVFPQHTLTDSFRINGLNENLQTNIPKGDNISINIAAASIIAKVHRDNIMVKLHEQNEGLQKYNFAQHKGYGTKQHIDAIFKHGPCQWHRKSFSPVSTFFS